MMMQLSKTYGVKFKLNTVVCSHNKDEDMSELVKLAAPFRWKVFQVRRRRFQLELPT